MKEEICIYFSALTKNPAQWAPNTFYAILSNDGESVTCYITSKTGEPKIVTSDGSLVFENLNFNSEKHTIAKIGINDIEETVTSFEKFELNGTDLEIEFNKEDGTKQVITVDLSSLGGNNCGCPTGLEIADEGNGNGWRLIGRNPDNYGNLGKNAIDFSVSNSASTTIGATGDRSVQFGRNNTTSGKGSMTLGENNINPFNNSLVVGSEFIGESTNGYSQGNIFLADYTKNNLKVYNNIYSSLIGGSDASVGTQGATLNQAVVYQSIINGWNSNIYGGESSLAVGHALLGGAARCAIVGAANIDLTQTTATQRTDDIQAYNPRFIVGVGDWNSDTNTGTRANGFVVMSDGTASFPSLTNLMIDNSDGKSAVTKDWVIANSGGGGSTGDLQAVTDIGATTTNDITISAFNNTDTKVMKLEGTENSFFSIVSKGISNPVSDYGIKYKADRIVSRGSDAPYLVRGQYIFPDLGNNNTERYLPVSVNGEVADVNGNITVATGGGGGIPDAPADGQNYGRQDNAWEVITSLTDAPSDGKQYARKNADWEEIIEIPPLENYTDLSDAVSVNLPTVNIPLNNALQAKEDDLGNPVTDGFVLSSTTAGVRSWIPMSGSGGGIAEAPVDGIAYARKDAAWAPVVTTGISDAPADGEIYARKDNTWVKVFEGLGFIVSEDDITVDASSKIITLGDSLDVGFVALNGALLKFSEWTQSGTSLTVSPDVLLKDEDYITIVQASPKGNNVGGGSGGGGTLLKDVQLIGDNVNTTITVYHNLGTEDLSAVRIIDVATKEVVQASETIIDSNSINLTFSTAPTTDQYKIITTA